MKKATVFIIVTVVLFTAFFSFLYLSREVEVGGIGYSAAKVSLTLSKVNTDTLPMELRPFWRLKTVDLTSCIILKEDGEKLEESRPDVQFIYTPYIKISDSIFPSNTSILDLSSIDFTLENLEEKLTFFENLTEVDLGKKTVTEDEFYFLQSSFPHITFRAVISHKVGDSFVRADTEYLDLTAFTGDIAEILKLFSNLKTVDLRGNEPSREAMLQLNSSFPQIKFIWNVEFMGESIPHDTERFDLTYKKKLVLDEVKDTISLLPELKVVDAGYSSLTNEELESLRVMFPNLEIHWVVHMGKWSLRTDAVTFSVLIYNYDHKRLKTEDIQVLKYCTKLQALDIGHQAISDISVIGDYLTELRLLILADNRITDLTPLAKLKHLHYLEFFVNQVTDLSPLAQCLELVDLNISYNRSLKNIDPLLDLPLLERLWLEHIPVSKDDLKKLQLAHPNCKIVSEGEGSVDKGWRVHPRYIALRDMFNNNYISEEFTKYDNLVRE